VRDLVQWLRLQLNDGLVDGQQVVDAVALAETHRPQMISRPPRDPATDRAGFYGLGWGVTYDGQGQVMLGHSGGFNLGAATGVSLLPAEKLGIVVLTNGSPIGVPETVALSFLDLVRVGAVQQDYLAQLRPAIAAQNGPTYGTALDYARPPANQLRRRRPTPTWGCTPTPSSATCGLSKPRASSCSSWAYAPPASGCCTTTATCSRISPRARVLTA
jgi:CubicO group peptidase (beta-lactamase class C family)